MTLFERIRNWTWAADWRTWIAHGTICFLVAFVGLRLGDVFVMLGPLAIAYYFGREDIFDWTVPYTRDRVMDALSAFMGGVAGSALGLVL